MNLRQGITLDSRYVLIERLGRGGQGSVWKALDQSTRETRAVKILDFADRDSIERAHREAELVTRERHPALITCHSLFRLPAEDMLVLVFDFVESIQLSAALREERFGRAHRLAALRHIAGALAYLHGRRIVHRDLKPDNVLVTPVFWEDPAAPSSLKIIDFGIAGKPTGQDGATLSGMFGTVPYMAPELFAGADVEAQRSPSRDVFAFGVIGWELLHGGHPTCLSSRAGASAYRETYRHFGSKREAWPPDELAGRWGSTVAACLALEPAMRPSDGRAILDLLEDRSPSRAAPHSTGAATEAMREEAGAPPRAEPAGATAKHRAPSSTSSEEPAMAAGAPSPASSRARPSARRSSPATLASAPATAAVARTEIAPVTSLPRASLPDRTTPMPPAIESLPAPQPQPYERGSKEETTNGSEPSTPSRDGSRYSGPPETVTVSAPSAWPIVAVAIALAGAVAGLLAWALLVRSKGGGDGLGTSSSSGGMSPSPPVWLAPPSSKSANEIGASSATTSTEATSAASGTPSPADALIACCDKSTTCSSGRTCKGAGQCTKEVPDARPFALRIVDVSRESPYENRKNLSDPDEYPASEVCVTVAASGQTVAATACLRMKAIAAKKEGARLDRIILRASDIREGRLSLQVSATGRKKAIDSPLQGAGLKSTALCGTVRLFDKSKEYSMAVYLDDPPSAAREAP